MAHVSLGKGRFAIIDDEDVERVCRHRWQCTRSRQKAATREYARRAVQRNGKATRIYMHRFILDAPDGLQVDHINGNGLDNRKENLRLATHTQNVRNSRPRRSNTSGYKGVTRHYGRWMSQITANRERFCLGTFDTPEEAARAYDAAAKKHYGEFAWLNFPDE